MVWLKRQREREAEPEKLSWRWKHDKRIHAEKYTHSAKYLDLGCSKKICWNKDSNVLLDHWWSLKNSSKWPLCQRPLWSTGTKMRFMQVIHLFTHKVIYQHHLHVFDCMSWWCWIVCSQSRCTNWFHCNDYCIRYSAFFRLLYCFLNFFFCCCCLSVCRLNTFI